MIPRRQASTARRSSTALIVVVLLAVAAAAIAAVLHFTSATAPTVTPASLAPVEPGGKSRGRPAAPVTIEVFSDFL